MKKVVTILALAFVFTTTTQAQKKDRKEEHEPMKVEQRTNLIVKKMTLRLDLDESQQRKIRPLIAEKVAKRKAMHAERKAMKKNKKERKKMSADERYKKQNARLDDLIAFKSNMKNILTEKQYEKFEKKLERKISKHKKRIKKGKRKHKKEIEE